jgi:hypothetical protein
LFAIGKGNGPFNISGTGDLTLRNVYIKGFHIKGGDGGDGRATAVDCVNFDGAGAWN